jgi:hypothetical protein
LARYRTGQGRKRWITRKAVLNALAITFEGRLIPPALHRIRAVPARPRMRWIVGGYYGDPHLLATRTETEA